MESNTGYSTNEGKLAPQGLIFSLTSLYACLLQIHDQRKRRGIRCSLVSILRILILARFCELDKSYAIAD